MISSNTLVTHWTFIWTRVYIDVSTYVESHLMESWVRVRMIIFMRRSSILTTRYTHFVGQELFYDQVTRCPMLPIKKYRQDLHAAWGFAHTQNAKGEDSLQTFKKFFCEILKQLWKSTYLCSWKIRWRTSSIKWNSSWRFPNGKKTFWRWQHRNRKHRHLRKSSRRTLHFAVTSRWPDTSDSRADEFMTPSCPFHFWSSEQRDGKFARRCMDMIYPSNYFCPFSSISARDPLVHDIIANFQLTNHIRSRWRNRLIRQLSVWSGRSQVSRFKPRVSYLFLKLIKIFIIADRTRSDPW